MNLYRTIGNALNGSESLFLKEIKGPLLYVTSQNQALERIANNLKFIGCNKEIIILPQWDCLPYDISSPSISICKQRVQTLSRLAIDQDQHFIVITTPSAIIQRVPSIDNMRASTLRADISQKISRQALLTHLYDNGFVRYSTAEEAGEYAVRGSILDVVLDSETGYRIDFFGDKVESVRLYHPTTQLSYGEKIKAFEITSASEVILTTSTTNQFQKKYLSLFGLRDDPLYHSIASQKKHPGMEHWLPLFYEKTSTVFDYLPNNCIIAIENDALHQVEGGKWEEINDYYTARQEFRKGKSNNLLEPNIFYLNPEVIKAHLAGFDTTILIPSPILNKQADANISVIRTPSLYTISRLNNIPIYQLLRDFINSGCIDGKKYDVQKLLIACSSEGSREKLFKILADNQFVVQMVDDWQQTLKLPLGVIGLANFAQSHSCIYQNIIFIGENDILGERQNSQTNRKRGGIKHLHELHAIAIGDYIVHIDHGIGIFSGLESLHIEGKTRDFIKLTYHGDDRLYVPVENFELISRYSDSEAHAVLDKLGSLSWQKRKASIKNRIKLAAEQLVATAAARKVSSAPVLQPNGEMYELFCQKFPYVETDDQMCAIEDTLVNLNSSTPSDRLICGDVGFGKTEVAMRAAAAAALSIDTPQVAIVVPTTLLARQHYANFCERFKGFPVKVGQISRLITATEAKKTKELLADGKIDIVIGTHSLLAKDVKFKNLGLIVIDEEQHFGVAQKEKLKHLKSGVHLLTLSATPIPRTMQLSLAGIKELSLISTPPMDRLPIVTVVMPFDPLIIREAIMRERYRNGRIFFITPRISYIDELKAQLSKLVPEIKIGVAHGAMPASQLDKIMVEFADGVFDLLICTTIIESGLDIENANTIIIDRAEMFGLAQLYQIRGRVGRSKMRAYAYLICKQKALSEAAKKRLEVIQNLDYTGAGMAIATHDMDIRGYGNLLGEEQSGHIKEVGVELYQSMLNEAVSNTSLGQDETEDSWSPLLNLDVDVTIPGDYIGDTTLKLTIYKQLAQIDNLDDLQEFKANLEDRFGPIPHEADNLVHILELKLIAKQKLISRIDCGLKAVVISFKNSSKVAYEKIMAFITTHAEAKLRPDGKLIIERVWQKDQSKLSGLRQILEEL